MPKEIILYNLADNVTDEQYAQYVNEKKGPFFMQLPAVKNFTLIRVTGSVKGEIPYKYVGIVDVTSMEDWGKVASSPAFGEFMQEWVPKVKEFHVLSGIEVFKGKWKCYSERIPKREPLIL